MKSKTRRRLLSCPLRKHNRFMPVPCNRNCCKKWPTARRVPKDWSNELKLSWKLSTHAMRNELCSRMGHEHLANVCTSSGILLASPAAAFDKKSNSAIQCARSRRTSHSGQRKAVLWYPLLINCKIYTLVDTLFYRKLCRRRSLELFPDNRHLARLTTIEEFVGLLCLFDWKPMRHYHFWMEVPAHEVF